MVKERRLLIDVLHKHIIIKIVVRIERPTQHCPVSQRLKSSYSPRTTFWKDTNGLLNHHSINKTEVSTQKNINQYKIFIVLEKLYLYG